MTPQFKLPNDAEFAAQISQAGALAMSLLKSERLHHAFCQRAPKVLNILSFDKDSIMQGLVNKSPEQAHLIGALAKEFEYVAKVALGEEDSQHETLKRRSIIVLADIMEGVFESFVQIFLYKSDIDVGALQNLTKFKGASKGSFDSLNAAVRNWERTLFNKFSLRSDRIAHMFSYFIPFHWNKLTDKNAIDRIFVERNRLTHEIVRVSSVQDMSQKFADASNYTVNEVNEFFNVSLSFLQDITDGIGRLHSSGAMQQ